MPDHETYGLGLYAAHSPGEPGFMHPLRAERSRALRIGIIATIVFVVMVGHYLTPIDPHGMHALHVVLQLLFVLPAILAAAWFGLRGAVITVTLFTILYAPHIVFQWTGHLQENINQVGGLATIWLTAVIAGALMDREKVVLRTLDQTHEGALIALVSALDAREHNTQLHSLRVRAYALRLGQAMNLSDKELAVLGDGALLHDIGKIGVPDRVLLKEGALDKDEWRLIQRHAEIGRHILESVPFLNDAARVVYSHHEKVDGSGYPEGLSKEDIPLEARIFAVVDALDALTSDRPYHRKITFEEAMRKMEKDKGTHFDPRVIRDFLSVPVQEWEKLGRAIVAGPSGSDLSQGNST